MGTLVMVLLALSTVLPTFGVEVLAFSLGEVEINMGGQQS